MNEHDLIRQAAEGDRARALVENETLTKAFDALAAAYVTAWRQTEREDVAGRERLFMAANVIDIVRESLMNTIANGNVAKADIELIIAAKNTRV